MLIGVDDMSLLLNDPKSVIAQIRAADKLSTDLEISGIKLNSRLVAFVRNNPEVAANSKALNSLISKAVYEQAGAQAVNMVRFIEATTGVDPETLLFAQANAKGMFIETSKISKQVANWRTLQPLNNVGGVLSNFVMGQVDDTQVKYRPRGHWARHLNSSACDWCQEQVSAYELTGRWLRHANCRCTKIFVKN